jgi:hypothetical protein
MLDFGTSRWQLQVNCYIVSRACERGANGSNWPLASASQFGPRPLLVEPDIAIGIDQ